MILRKTILILCAFAVVQIASIGFAAETYYNVSNAPFATVSNGPQNAMVVDVANPQDKAEVDRAVNLALSQFSSTTRSAKSTVSRQMTKLREAGLIRSDAGSEIYGTVLVRSNGSLTPVTRGATTYGGGTITFTYSGWTADEEAILRAFVNIAYPLVKSIYGDPARTITVNVTKDVAQIDRDSLLGGVYVSGNVGSPEIKLTNYSSVISLERSFLHLMIHAFHDTAAFNYDAWEEGFTRAASVAASEEIDKVIARDYPAGPLKKMDFVGRDLGDAFYYVMSNYEMLNQPPLANNTFFTSWADTLQGGDKIAGMIIPRLGMSSTAWIKVYIERLRADGQSFFKLFNQTYYSQLSSNSSLAGNVPSLKSIAAGVTSNVEGAAFNDWYQEQYVLDTSVSIGRKLYAFTFPPEAPANPDAEGYSIPVFLIYYSTTATGDETPLSGTVYPAYLDYTYGTDLYLSGQYEAVPIDSGEGYVTPTFFTENIGGAQRVAMDFTIGTETTRVYFPAGMTGTASSPRNLIGAIIGNNGGTVVARVDNDATGTSAAVTQGAFGESVSLVTFSRLAITYTPASGGSAVTRFINVGPGSYTAYLRSGGDTKSLVHTFPGGMNLMSLPMYTLAQDQVQALQNGSGSPAVPTNKLLIARWNPGLSSAYKYEMYPQAPPFAPGRAYWMKLPGTTNITVTGKTPDPTSDWRIGLVYGWNQVGCPFESAVPLSSIRVEAGSDDPVSFDDAWSTGIIGKIVWKYIPNAAYDEATSLEPWQGYWIKCNNPDGAVLIIPGPNSPNRSRSTSVAASSGSGKSKSVIQDKNAWAMKLTAGSVDGDVKTKVTLGMAPGATDGFDNAYDAEFPPSYDNKAVSVSAVMPGRSGESCAVDTRAISGTKTSWEIAVTPSEPNQDIILKWEDVLKAPKKYRLTIVDQSTGRSQYLRTSSSYRFNSGDGSPRRFTVIADSTTPTRLMITNLTAASTRGTNVSFSYNMTTDASVSAEIISSSGSRIRRIEPGKTTRSGINTLSWDKRDEQGKQVPAGVYMIQLTAATEDGEIVKSARPLLISR